MEKYNQPMISEIEIKLEDIIAVSLGADDGNSFSGDLGELFPGA